MKLYSIDVVLNATVYVKASSKKAAKAKAEKWIQWRPVEVSGGDISGRVYDDPMLPTISLSPAMTGQRNLDAEPERVS